MPITSQRKVDVAVIPLKSNVAPKDLTFLVLFEPPSPGVPADAKSHAVDPSATVRRSTRYRGRTAAGRVAGHARASAVGDRAAGSVERGAAIGERGNPVGQRRAAKHQRGARDVEGGDRVDQRGAVDGQRRAAAPQPRADAGQQRHAEPAQQRAARHPDPRTRPAHPPLHAAGRSHVEPGGRRRRPARQRRQTDGRRPRSRGEAARGDRHRDGQAISKRRTGKAAGTLCACARTRRSKIRSTAR